MNILASSDSGLETVMVGLFAWVFGSFVAAGIANAKGRSGVGWFFVAFLLSPLLGIIITACLPRDEKALEHRELKKGRRQCCPACREIVKKGASICRYCGHNFSLCKCPQCGMGFAY